jgi:hypothetical protein
MAREVKSLLQDVAPEVGPTPVCFSLGQRVKARFGASGAGPSGTQWFPGAIALVRADGLYDIQYEDGDREEAVLPRYIKAADDGQRQASPSVVGAYKKRRQDAQVPGPSDVAGDAAGPSGTQPVSSSHAHRKARLLGSAAAVAAVGRAEEGMAEEEEAVESEGAEEMAERAAGVGVVEGFKEGTEKAAEARAEGAAVVEGVGSLSVPAEQEGTLLLPSLPQTLADMDSVYSAQLWSILSAASVRRARRAARAAGWEPQLTRCEQLGGGRETAWPVAPASCSPFTTVQTSPLYPPTPVKFNPFSRAGVLAATPAPILLIRDSPSSPPPAKTGRRRHSPSPSQSPSLNPVAPS